MLWPRLSSKAASLLEAAYIRHDLCCRLSKVNHLPPAEVNPHPDHSKESMSSLCVQNTCVFTVLYFYVHASLCVCVHF